MSGESERHRKKWRNKIAFIIKIKRNERTSERTCVYTLCTEKSLGHHRSLPTEQTRCERTTFLWSEWYATHTPIQRRRLWPHVASVHSPHRRCGSIEINLQACDAIAIAMSFEWKIFDSDYNSSFDGGDLTQNRVSGVCRNSCSHIVLRVFA